MNSPDDKSAASPSGLEQLRNLMAAGQRPGIAVSLDFNLVEIELGRAVFAGKPGVHAYSPLGLVHGGYAATLLDSACGCALHSRLSGAQSYVTLELKVAFHKAMTRDTGVVRAEGRVVSLGRRVGYTEAALSDMNGTLYASATSTLLLVER